MNSTNDPHAEPVPVGEFASVGEAEVAVAHLRASGIEATLIDSVEGGALRVQGESGVIVEVHAADADEAQRLLGAGSEPGEGD
jgi:hypothetical protein